MAKWSYRITLGILFCCLAAALPALAQDNQQQSNDHPEHQKQAQNSEHRTQRPETNSHPSQHNEARPQQQNHRTNSERPAPGYEHQRMQANRAEHPAQNRTRQRRASQGHRPAQWGRPPAHRGSYSFRSNDRARLHSYYMSRFGDIDRANRPVFRVGGYFPYAYIGYLSPLPPELYGTLPPPPPGYEMGYYDGYVIVYDPVTGFIVSVIDLLQ